MLAKGRGPTTPSTRHKEQRMEYNPAQRGMPGAAKRSNFLLHTQKLCCHTVT